MACAVPCVTTDVGDAALIVGATGWVCPPRDADALAAAIIAALAEPATAHRERGLAARRRIVENFGLARMAEAYRKLWSGGGEAMVACGRVDASSTRRSCP
jgi:glycosyltransferase involved in cell wall biosynthesis